MPFSSAWVTGVAACLIGLTAMACDGEPTAPEDGGPADGGSPPSDAGATDAEVPHDGGLRLDAGLLDAGDGADAGSSDGGLSDAGPTDAGSSDAGLPDAGLPDAGLPDAGLPDAGLPDAGATCSSALTPTGSSIPDLVISEIDPGTFIEVFNTTGSDIALASSSYQFCSPFNYRALSALAPSVVVPAGGYASLPWPAAFADTDASGEILLYASGSFGTSSDIMDFVCWGPDPTGTRKSQAESVGRWSGGCAAAITGSGSLARLSSTDGTQASHYDSSATPTPETCAP